CNNNNSDAPGSIFIIFLVPQSLMMSIGRAVFRRAKSDTMASFQPLTLRKPIAPKLLIIEKMLFNQKYEPEIWTWKLLNFQLLFLSIEDHLYNVRSIKISAGIDLVCKNSCRNPALSTE